MGYIVKSKCSQVTRQYIFICQALLKKNRTRWLFIIFQYEKSKYSNQENNLLSNRKELNIRSNKITPSLTLHAITEDCCSVLPNLFMWFIYKFPVHPTPLPLSFPPLSLFIPLLPHPPSPLLPSYPFPIFSLHLFSSSTSCVFRNFLPLLDLSREIFISILWAFHHLFVFHPQIILFLFPIPPSPSTQSPLPHQHLQLRMFPSSLLLLSSPPSVPLILWFLRPARDRFSVSPRSHLGWRERRRGQSCLCLIASAYSAAKIRGRTRGNK